MKKLFLCFVLVTGYLITEAQFFCYDTIEHEDRTGDYCTRSKPKNNTDTALFISRYIPNELTPIVTIPVNVHVWRKDDGTGNWWQDTPAFRDSLQLAFDYLNHIYSHNVTYSLYIPNTQFIEDTKVRFEIDTVYYHNNSQLAYDTTTGPFIDYLASNFPECLNNFNYHLAIDSLAARSGCSNGYNNPSPTIVSVHQHKPKHLYGFAVHMAHEFGHTFGLHHTYLNDPLEVNLIGSNEFLWDVFGTVQQPWCQHMSPGRVCMHDGGWDCDPYDTSNTCTNNIMGSTQDARHFSALQCGRIQRALQVSSLRHFAYGEENPPDLHITDNQLVDYTRKYYQTVIVDSGVTLTITCQVEMSPNARLIVRPGGKLVVDGGTLTSACDGEMWQGIEVVGDHTKRQIPQWQGTVELKNGAVIENAHCGIRTGLGEDNWHTTGGIIKADSSFFINNRRAVEFLSYVDTTASGTLADNQSYFHNTVFTVDNNNLFAANSCEFIDHVTLWQVKGVKFRGCTFSNLTNGHSNRKHAIYAFDAGITLETYCSNEGNGQPSTNPGCECPEEYSAYNSFYGFNTAVKTGTSGEQFPILIDRAMFGNNDTAIDIGANQYATVIRCQFDLQQSPNPAANCGLYLNTCTGYKVEGNRFHKAVKFATPTSTGIRVNNSGSASNKIYKNLFDTLDYGIVVTQNNSGLQLGCDTFTFGGYDIYILPNGSIASNQGSLQQGADNKFVNTQISSLYNAAQMKLKYYHSPLQCHIPRSPYNASVYGTAAACDCPSTLCNGGIPGPGPVTSFASQVSAYTAAAGNANTDGGTVETQNLVSLQTIHQSLSDTYHAAVRAIMSDTVLDLNELEMWHTAAQPIADPYSLTETRFMEGYAEIFAENAETDAEMANYAEFHALKLALRGDNADNDNNDNTDNNNSQNSPKINWYALTPAQIAQLQTIAERNTGRASVMAKGVLCFFHGICYEDEWDNAGVFDTPQPGDDTTGTRAKRVATDNSDDAALSVYPNPTDDILFIELHGGAEIANVALYDLQGRIVTGVFDTPQRGGTATITVKSIPAGVYVLRVTDVDGKEYHRKIVRK